MCLGAEPYCVCRLSLFLSLFLPTFQLASAHARKLSESLTWELESTNLSMKGLLLKNDKKSVNNYLLFVQKMLEIAVVLVV